MATFRDAQGREWELRLDAPTIQRIRDDCDPLFLKNDFIDNRESTPQRLAGDPVLLCRVLYLLCEDQRRERNITEKEFYLGVVGDAIDAAADALEGVMRSFSSRRTRKVLEVFAKEDAIQREQLDAILRRMDDPSLASEWQKQLDHAIRTTWTQLSPATDSPEQPESTPEG